MFAINDTVGISILITAVTTAIVTIIAAIFSGLAMLRTGRVVTKVEAVHEEVKTHNELTLGQIGERTETRRISEINPIERTEQEQRHMVDMENRESSGR